MSKTNLAQHVQHLKSLETTTQEIDQSYQQIVDSHKQKDDALQQVVDSHKQMYNGLCDLSNLIFGLFQIVRDLKETHLILEKESQEL